MREQRTGVQKNEQGRQQRLIRLEARAAEYLHMGVRLLPVPDGDPAWAGDMARAGGAACAACTVQDGRACARLYTRLYRQAAKTGAPAVASCGDSGLGAAVLPVLLDDGALVAAWVLYGFSYRQPGSSAPVTGRVEGQAPTLTENGLQLLWRLLSDVARRALTENDSPWQPEQKGGEAFQSIPGLRQLESDVSAMQSGCLVVLEVVDYRRVNGAYGPKCTDLLFLKLQNHLAGLDVAGKRVYQMEPAQFGLLLNTTDTSFLQNLARRLRDECAKPWRLEAEGETAEIHFLAAIAVLPFRAEMIEKISYLSSAVAHTMRRAIQEGGIAWFSEDHARAFTRRVGIERELREAVGAGMRGFSLMYQPIVDPGNSLWKGLEALCRWESPRYGRVSPEEFIPIAEHTGLINPLGLWVLEQALADIKALGVEEAEQFVLDVNVSPVQLADTGLDEKIFAILESTGYPPGKLCLEITESSEVNIEGSLMDMLYRLRERGVRIALDDFGVGYASVSSLYKLPVNVVKTDRSLVSGVQDNAFLQRVFYVMSEMAHACDMHIVAEGVETDAEMSTVLAEGADFIQGYQFFPPLHLEDIRQKRSRFFNSLTHKPLPEYSRVDIEQPLEDAYHNYYLPPSLYRVLNRCMQALFTNPDGDAAVEQVLAFIGQAVQVSRATVFLRTAENQYSITHQWCAPGIPSGKGIAENLEIDSLSPLWGKTLREDSMLVVADISTVDEGIRNLMEGYGVVAMAEFALWQNEQIMGFVCFEDCIRPHYWTREEVRMLYMLGNMLAGALLKDELRMQSARHNRQMRSILDSMDAMIFVADPHSGEILFANACLRDICGVDDLTGRLCWQTLYRRDSRCGVCPVPDLLAQPDKTHRLEVFNELLGEYMQASILLIPWEDGRTAVLSCYFDISDLKRRELTLAQSAYIDPLTKVMNRSGFFAAAQTLLDMSGRERKPITLVFLDVDGLKRQNDLHGHLAGDELLCTVASRLQNRLRASDLVGRYGGDEFVLMLYDCRPAHARKVMEGILAELAQMNRPDIGRYYSFSYGLAGKEGAKSGHKGRGLRELIQTADGRMMDYKQTHRSGGRNSETAAPLTGS